MGRDVGSRMRTLMKLWRRKAEATEPVGGGRKRVSVFAVHMSGEPIEKPTRQLQKHYPDHYRVSDRFYLVCCDGTVQDVVDRIGIDGRDLAGTGVVFELKRFYAGYERRALWDWLGSAEQKVWASRRL